MLLAENRLKVGFIQRNSATRTFVCIDSCNRNIGRNVQDTFLRRRSSFPDSLVYSFATETCECKSSNCKQSTCVIVCYNKSTQAVQGTITGSSFLLRNEWLVKLLRQFLLAISESGMRRRSKVLLGSAFCCKYSKQNALIVIFLILPIWLIFTL